MPIAKRFASTAVSRASFSGPAVREAPTKQVKRAHRVSCEEAVKITKRRTDKAEHVGMAHTPRVPQT
jgi:hypothetical protein